MQKKENNFPAFIDLFFILMASSFAFLAVLIWPMRGDIVVGGWLPPVGRVLFPGVSHWQMRKTNVADGMLLLVRVLWIWRQMDLICQWERPIWLMECSYWSGSCGSGAGWISLANERGQSGWWNAPIGQSYVDLAPDVSHWPMREANVADEMLLLVRVMWIWRRMYLIDQWERPMWLMNAPIGQGLCEFGAAAAAGGALLPDRAGTLVESNPCGVPDCPGTEKVFKCRLYAAQFNLQSKTLWSSVADPDP